MKRDLDLDLVDVSEVAAIFGLSRKHVLQRIVPRPDFPAPAINLSNRSRKWRRADVLRWAATANKNPRFS